MTVTTNTATVRGVDVAPSAVGDGKQEIVLTRTVELAASESASTINFCRIPSNARITGLSRVYWDDLATSGSPTLDIGLFAVDGNVTSDDDALNDGLALSAVSTAGIGSPVVKDIANYGLPAWDHVANVTADPGGFLDVKGTVKDASTTATGTVTLELRYFPG